MHQTTAVTTHQGGHIRRQRIELFVRHGHRRFWQFDAEQSSEPATATVIGPRRRRTPGRPQEIHGLILNSQLSQHVTRVVIRHLLHPRSIRHQRDRVQRQKLRQFVCTLSKCFSTDSGIVITHHFEQLGPEHAHHGGARPGRHHHHITTIGLQCRQRGASHLGCLMGKAGVPRRLTATRLGQRHADLASGGA